MEMADARNLDIPCPTLRAHDSAALRVHDEASRTAWRRSSSNFESATAQVTPPSRPSPSGGLRPALIAARRRAARNDHRSSRPKRPVACPRRQAANISRLIRGCVGGGCTGARRVLPTFSGCSMVRDDDGRNSVRNATFTGSGNRGSFTNRPDQGLAVRVTQEPDTTIILIFAPSARATSPKFPWSFCSIVLILSCNYLRISKLKRTVAARSHFRSEPRSFPDLLATQVTHMRQPTVRINKEATSIASGASTAAIRRLRSGRIRGESKNP